MRISDWSSDVCSSDLVLHPDLTASQISTLVWDEWSPAMHSYMIQDGRVNLALYRYLMDQGVSLQAMQLEMRVQRLCSQIERNGWPFDRKAAEELYATLCAERDRKSTRLNSSH